MAKKKNVYGAKRMKEALTGYGKSFASRYGGGGLSHHRNMKGSQLRKSLAERHKSNRKHHSTTHIPTTAPGVKGYRHELIKRHAM